MVKKIRSIRGMNDCLPKDTVIWQHVEKTIANILNNYGYEEIRFPILELTELFKNSLGEVTDVIEKEMYSFKDRNGENLTLRPEGTIGCVRTIIEHGLFYNQNQKRLWYKGPMFRRERPQKGRYRQFHQFGAEVFGSEGPDIDVELILIVFRCWKTLEIDQYLSLELNSIGSLESRILYKKELVSFLERNIHHLDDKSMRRLYSNPIRILDTKNDKIKRLLVDAPELHDFLDNDSRVHFKKICKLLNFFKIPYIVNPHLVRGLDYYNRTVFEWIIKSKNVSQNSVCAGGRYDKLVESLSGYSVPAIGFAIGLERIVLLIKSFNINHFMVRKKFIDLYLLSFGDNAKRDVMYISEKIHTKLPSVRLITYYGNASLKRQYFHAKKSFVRFVLVFDSAMTLKKIALLKNLQSGQKEIVSYNKIIKKLKCVLNISDNLVFK